METGILAFFFSPKGRVNRGWYWAGTIMAGAIWSATFAFLTSEASPEAPLVVPLLISLVFGWPYFVITVKRWHDRDKSAWWLLIHLIPLWTQIECGFFAGRPANGPNRYGEPFDEPL